MTVRFQATPLAAGPSGDVGAAAERQSGRTPDGAMAPALLADGAAAPNVPLLFSGKALAVTSGQQAGLFSGPLYTVYKALSAAAFAKEIEERGEGKVVPVFWVAGDDHDFAEINHCTVIGQDGRPAKVVIRERAPDAPMQPAYREEVGLDGAAALARLEEMLPPGDARTETLAWLERAYAPERSLAEAHARAMAELLGPYGVVVARGWSADLKRAAKQVLLAALRGARQLDQSLRSATARLQALGGAAPVDVGEGLSLVMYEGRQGRDRLRIAGERRFETRRGTEAVTESQLEHILENTPELLSGNVLLRPAIEAAVFPTVGYFGGPGELAYLEQTAPVFEFLGVPRPARLPRLSGLLVEAKADKTLERFGLTPADLAQPEGALASRVAREGLPASAAEALAQLRATITERYAAVQAEVARVDKTLEKPVENARNQALVGSQEIEKKLVAALKRSSETAIQQAMRARDQLYPEGTHQERVISAVSFLARHGRPVLGLAYAAARDHARALLEAPSGRI